MADELQLLYQTWSQEITRGLRRRGALPELAEDLTQDTFLRALVSEPPASHPRAWLWRIALNLFTDHRRRERLVDWVQISDEAFEQIAARLPEAVDFVWHRQRLVLTAKALMEMPERNRRAFILFRLEGRTIREVAEVMGLSPSRSWTLVREAYLQIRTRLGEAP